MDSSESAVGGPTDCETVRPIHNNDMQEGDYYIVQSDSWHGKADPWHGTSHLARRPAECSLAFNFGDRLVSMSVDEWWCHLRDVHDPFLAIYNNCDGQRYGLLVSVSIFDQPRSGVVYNFGGVCLSYSVCLSVCLCLYVCL